MTNILALSSLRQLVAYRQMHQVKLRIDKRFYSSREANMVFVIVIVIVIAGRPTWWAAGR